MNSDKLQPGDRVKDRFKVPKAGDECVTGRVVAIEQSAVTVKWDDGKLNTVNCIVLEPADE